MKLTFREILWKGLLWSIPLVLTIWLAGFVFSVADAVMGPLARALVRFFAPEALLQGSFSNGHVPGLSLILMVILLACVGSFVSFRWGKSIAHFMEAQIQRVPAVGAVYRNAKKISDFFENAESAKFEGVVLVPYPHPEVLTLAFVTGKVQVIDASGEATIYLKAVIPNPPTGIQALPLIPQSLARDPGMTIEDGIQFYLSVSMVAPKSIKIAMPFY